MPTEVRLRRDPLAPFVKTHEQRALAAPTGAFRQLPARVVLEVPGAPVIGVLLPRNKPPPPIASSRSKPVDTRSVEASGGNSAVSGAATSMPCGPKLSGNSPGEKSEPRYFVISSRR